MDLPDLEQYFWVSLESAKKNYESWFLKKSGVSEDARSLSQSINDEGRAKVDQITERLKALDEDRKDQDDQQEELDSLKESLTVKNRRIEALQERIVELSDLRQRQEEIIATELAEIGETLSERRRKNDATQETIFWYEKNLGFRVEPSNKNALKFIFSKLEPANPEREFSFSIRHDKLSNLYTMLDCDPAVECSGELLDELNCTNELYKFITNMRNQFQANLPK